MGDDTGADNREGFRVLGLIPARKGSKSIQYKNRAELGNKPLYGHVLDAARACTDLDEIIISTNDIGLMYAKHPEASVRPDHLCTDDSPIIDTMRFHSEGFDAIALLQPTSPFVQPETIDDCIRILKYSPTANSIQTITTIPHNHHAYNQRTFVGGHVEFKLKLLREGMYNKQLKPQLYCFGNLVVTRTSALDKGVFAEPSIGVMIPRDEAIDIDTQEDLDYAQRIIPTREDQPNQGNQE